MADADETIRSEAAAWYFRRDAGPLAPEAEAEFQRWLSEPGHRSAYAEIAGTWSALSRIERPSMRPARRYLRHAVPGAALAAMLALAILNSSWWRHLGADAATGVGETEEIVLADGSRVDLNTDTAIQIRYDGRERRIRVVGGEALFTVAKDPGRPFVVETASGSATALGTVFSVRQDANETVVTVLESRVAVEPGVEAGQAATLASGQSVRFSSTKLDAIETVDADARTAWRRGKLIFIDKPLGEVIDELNRYHRGYIRIVDPGIRRQRVNGVFETRDPLHALDLVQTSLGLRSTRLTDYLVLLHR